MAIEQSQTQSVHDALSNAIATAPPGRRIVGVGALWFLTAAFSALSGGCSVASSVDGPAPSEATGTARQAVVGASAVVYGSSYHLQNGYANNGGGYLDTRDAGCNGNTLCVSTATSSNRDTGSGSWIVLSADGKLPGTQVKAGDHVYLANKYPYISGTGNGLLPSQFGGYLDTDGAGCQGDQLCVSTAASSNRDSGSGMWTVGYGSPGTVVTEGVAITLFNQWKGNGGYLDTRDAGCQGNELCVSTSTSADRDSGSGSWTLTLDSPYNAPAVVYGSSYNLQNGYYSTQNGYTNGGYLDTRDAGCNGNLLCVSTSTVNNRDTGSGSWTLLSADGKLPGAPVTAGDHVYLANNYPYISAAGNGLLPSQFGGYLDTAWAGCQGNQLCVSTSASSNRDSGSGTWTVGYGSPGTIVTEGAPITLFNEWQGNGGYLDTDGAGCQGNELCVSTSTSSNRDSGSGTWTLTSPPIYFAGNPNGMTIPQFKSMIQAEGFQIVTTGTLANNQCTVVYAGASANSEEASAQFGLLVCATELTDGLTLTSKVVYGGCNLVTQGGSGSNCEIGILQDTLSYTHAVGGENFTETFTVQGPSAEYCSALSVNMTCAHAGATIASTGVSISDDYGNGVGTDVSEGVDAGVNAAADNGTFSASFELAAGVGLSASFSFGYRDDGEALYRVSKQGWAQIRGQIFPMVAGNVVGTWGTTAAIANDVTGQVATFGADFGRVSSALATDAGKAFVNGGETFVDGVNSVGSTVKTWSSEVASGITSAGSTIINGISSGASAVGSAIVSAGNALGNALGNAGTTIENGFCGFFHLPC
jgi:hypothetical protein